MFVYGVVLEKDTKATVAAQGPLKCWQSTPTNI